MAVGTIIWTSPTGHTYTTYPGSKHHFPGLCAPTAMPWTGEPPVVESASDRVMMMPKRRHTRAHNTARAIAAERRLNDPIVTQRNKPPPFSTCSSLSRSEAKGRHSPGTPVPCQSGHARRGKGSKNQLYNR
jgi:hypothetical protein